MSDTAVLRHHLTPLAPLLEAPEVTELGGIDIHRIQIIAAARCTKAA